MGRTELVSKQLILGHFTLIISHSIYIHIWVISSHSKHGNRNEEVFEQLTSDLKTSKLQQLEKKNIFINQRVVIHIIHHDIV